MQKAARLEIAQFLQQGFLWFQSIPDEEHNRDAEYFKSNIKS